MPDVSFLEYHRPPLRDGNYTLTATLAIPNPTDAHASVRTELVTVPFTVSGDRFTLPPNVVQHVFPPNHAQGAFDNCLPHIVLSRDTLPWERSPHGEGHEEPLTPSWLALLVFHGEEAPVVKQVLAKELESQTPAKGCVPLPAEAVHDPELQINVIDVPAALCKKLIPSYADLGLCAHVRSDSGAPAASANIVSTRLPQPSATNTVHLVSLEHRYTIERTAPPPPPGPVTDLILALWSTVETDFCGLENSSNDNAPGLLNTMEAEAVITAGAPARIFTPKISNENKVTLPPGIQPAAGLLDPKTYITLSYDTHTILDEKGRRRQCPSLTARFQNDVPKDAPTLPATISALFANRPPNIARAHIRDGFSPVYFTESAGPAVDPKDLVETLFRDPYWEHQIKIRGRARLERWWAFDGINRRLIVDVVRLGESYKLTLTITPERRFAFNANAANDEPVRLVTLHSWTFHCDPAANSHFGPRGFRLAPPSDSDGALRLPITSPDFHQWFDAGYTLLPHSLRSGESTVSWYRGPLAAALPSPAPAPELPVPTSDALLQFDPQSGLFDTSLAAAWELGRNLALADRGFSRDLVLWKRSHRESQYALRRRLDAQALTLQAPSAIDTGIPESVSNWLQSLALLEGVPFAYLVPDERMLPPESLRFFQLDPAWVESLRDGALSIGRVHSADHARHDVHREQFPAPQPANGVIIRSSVLKDWPDLVIRAYTQTATGDPKWQTAPSLSTGDYKELQALRTARLAPDLVLILYPAVAFDMLEMHVQPQMLHFGLEGTANAWKKDLKNPNDGSELQYVSKASLSAAAAQTLADKEPNATYRGALQRRATRWKAHPEDLRVWEGDDLALLRAGVPSLKTSMDPDVAAHVAQVIYDAATKQQSPESVPVSGSAWRDKDANVLNFSELFQRIALPLRPLVSDGAITSAHFALEMLDEPHVVRILRKTQ